MIFKKRMSYKKLILFLVFGIFLILFMNNLNAGVSVSDFNKVHKITINGSLINGSHTDFPVLLTEDNFDNKIFNNANDSGCDLRITTDYSGYNEIPLEVVDFNNSENTTEIWTKVNLTDATNKTLYIWYGNPSAECYDDSDTYGSENVWNDNYKLSSHNSLNDSTLNNNQGTEEGGVISGGAIGKIGSATEFDGTNDYVDLPIETLNGMDESGGTFTLWVYANFSDIGSGDVRIINSEHSLGGDYEFRTYHSNKISIYIGSGTLYNKGRAFPTGYTPQDNKWFLLNYKWEYDATAD
ncbi:MAG: DUF2341 domain-containing protein, partial [Nanoarchaeota archaeon]